MKLDILFAQRKCSYPGEYAPEALQVVTEFDYGENPDFIEGKLEDAKADSEFISASIIEVTLDDAAYKAIFDRLNGCTSVAATVT